MTVASAPTVASAHTSGVWNGVSELFFITWPTRLTALGRYDARVRAHPEARFKHLDPANAKRKVGEPASEAQAFFTAHAISLPEDPRELMQVAGPATCV